MQNLTESVQHFFRKEDISFQENNGRFKIVFAGDNGHFLCFVCVDEEGRDLHIETLLPLHVPANKRLKVAELITRINNYPFLGNFEFNMDEGTISYKTSIILGEALLHDDIIEYLLFPNWSAADRYFPAFVMVIFGDVPPKAAIEKVRKSKAHETQTEGTATSVLNIRLRDIVDGSIN